VKPAANVLLFDDAGDHTAMQAAQFLAEAGSAVEIMTPDRSFAPEVMGMNLVPYMRALQDKHVTFTVTYRLLAAERDGNRLKAIVGSDYMMELRQERQVDQIVVNHGTQPLADLYFELKPHVGESRRRRLRRAHRRPPANPERRPRRLPPLPHRRRGRLTQHPRGDLRRAAAGEGRLIAPPGRDLSGRNARQVSQILESGASSASQVFPLARTML
jgi:hypothetical protein